MNASNSKRRTTEEQIKAFLVSKRNAGQGRHDRWLVGRTGSHERTPSKRKKGILASNEPFKHVGFRNNSGHEASLSYSSREIAEKKDIRPFGHEITPSRGESG